MTPAAHEHHAVLVLDHQAAGALHVRRLRGGPRGGRTRPPSCAGPRWAIIQLLDFHLYRALTLAACFEEAGARGAAARTSRPSSGTTSSSRSGRRTAPRTSARPSGWSPRSWPASRAGRTRRSRAYEEAIQRGPRATASSSTWRSPASWRRASGASGRRPPSREAYARKAREAYLRWGAHGKVQHLDAQWPHLGLPRRPDGRATTATRTRRRSTRSRW